MYGGEAELVVAVHVRLVLAVLEQEPDVVQVDVLRRHVYGRAVQLRVHVVCAGPAAEQSLRMD